MLPDRVTAAAIAAELGAAHKWAQHENVNFQTVLPQRLIRTIFTHHDSGDRFFLQGRFDDYKELPPMWEWCDPDWSQPGNRQHSPNAIQTPFGSSIFLHHEDKAIICAPFNRLAFSACKGPHSDWGELSHWMSADQGCVYAVTIADMLDVIARDFRYSTGRMA